MCELTDIFCCCALFDCDNAKFADKCECAPFSCDPGGTCDSCEWCCLCNAVHGCDGCRCGVPCCGCDCRDFCSCNCNCCCDPAGVPAGGADYNNSAAPPPATANLFLWGSFCDIRTHQYAAYRSQRHPDTARKTVCCPCPASRERCCCYCSKMRLCCYNSECATPTCDKCAATGLCSPCCRCCAGLGSSDCSHCVDDHICCWCAHGCDCERCCTAVQCLDPCCVVSRCYDVCCVCPLSGNSRKRKCCGGACDCRYSPMHWLCTCVSRFCCCSRNKYLCCIYYYYYDPAWSDGLKIFRCRRHLMLPKKQLQKHDYWQQRTPEGREAAAQPAWWSFEATKDRYIASLPKHDDNHNSNNNTDTNTNNQSGGGVEMVPHPTTTAAATTVSILFSPPQELPAQPQWNAPTPANGLATGPTPLQAPGQTPLQAPGQGPWQAPLQGPVLAVQAPVQPMNSLPPRSAAVVEARDVAPEPPQMTSDRW